MRPKNIAFLLTLVAFVSVGGFVAVTVHAQTSQTAAKSSKTSRPAAASSADTSDKPYDWKASFAKVPATAAALGVKVGKVPRMPDGKPDLQGIWSRSILTPMERPANAKDKTEIDESAAKKAEDSAYQRQINLRIEPTDTPPGEKTTDAYNSFWRDGYWFKIPMTTLHTSQVVDPPDGRIPPLTPEALQRRYHMAMRADRPATGPEDRPLDSRCVRPIGVGPAFGGSGPGGQESTLRDRSEPKGSDRSCGSPRFTDNLSGRTAASSCGRSSGGGSRARALGRRHTRG